MFSASSDTFNLLIRALKTQGRIDILSRPQVMTLDNQRRRVLVGQSVPYVTGTNVTGTGIVTNSINYRDVGVQLKVTPQISPDGRVHHAGDAEGLDGVRRRSQPRATA